MVVSIIVFMVIFSVLLLMFELKNGVDVGSNTTGSYNDSEEDRQKK